MRLTFTFTPYGQPAILMQKLFDVKVPVIDWLPTDVARQSKRGSLPLRRHSHAVNATLWPQWDAAAGQWSTGGVTLDDMDYLTEADFYLLDRMGPPARGLDDKPASPTAGSCLSDSSTSSSGTKTNATQLKKKATRAGRSGSTLASTTPLRHRC